MKYEVTGFALTDDPAIIEAVGCGMSRQLMTPPSVFDGEGPCQLEEG